VELDLSEVEDITTRTTMFRALGQRPAPRGVTTTAETLDGGVPALDREVQRIIELGSRDRARILAVLADDEGIPAALVPHVVRLLAWDAVADDAVHALRTVAEERVGELTDALLDPNQPFAIRRRLPRVFSVCVSQRAADGLIWALDDIRFEVRFQCGRSLAAIVQRNPRVRIDAERVLEGAHREVAVSRPVWESRRLLDRLANDAGRSLVDDFVDVRANDSLAHVFTLLILAFPGEPLRIAFRGLHTDDARLRGTALEYLEHVLPPGLRERLWPWLEGARGPAASGRSRETVLADLLQSNPSIMMNLEELRRMHHSTTLESR
jgi:hypothetical protein